ncbi:MAG: DUF1257 domain-containing protein [Planctomycetes bacterium]|nr:DUF1257 domain-containing protein [Planctomycetota bacterium]
MSHIVSIKTEIRDVAAIRAACRRLNIDQPEEGTFKLFSGEATGVAVRLPDWTYPIVSDLATGELSFDNYNGDWGDQKELDTFLQAYAVEKARLEARKRGHTVTEQPLADGSVKLTIQVNGGAG